MSNHSEWCIKEPGNNCVNCCPTCSNCEEEESEDEMSDTARPTMTVDREQFKNWISGVLINMHNGVGMIVNEAECISANDALQRGETVLFRNGAELTGTAVKLIDGAYQEVEE